MKRIIGVIAAHNNDFIHFCKEAGFSLGSEYIKNLSDENSARGIVFSCLYITEHAKEKRAPREITKIKEIVVQHCQPMPW